jgi:CBS domain containing-hemolysin-like protein
MNWILLILALPLSFLLSGLETAVLSVSKVRLRHQVKEKKRAAARLQRLFRRRDRLLSATLILNHTLNILVFAIATDKLVEHFGNWGYLASIAVSLPIYLLLLELLAKSLFKRFPYRALVRFLPLLEAIYYIFGPFMFTAPLLRRILRGHETPDGGNREDFRSLTNIIEREGELGSYEKKLIQGVLDFNRLTVRDVMIPLSKVTAIPLEMPTSAALELARETGLDQFPVMSPKGEFVGLFDTFEALLANPSRNTVVHSLRRLVRTRTDESAVTIIRRLRRSGVPLAVVYDRAGQPLGIVSTSDLLQRMLHGP